MVDRRSQNKRIEEWLRAGKPLDPLTALEKFGSFRLGGRIHELRAEGMKIVTSMVTKNGKRFAQYSLEKP